MEYRTKQTVTVAGLIALILVLGGIFTYVVYLSPTGFKARENADLSRAIPTDAQSFTTLEGNTLDLDSYRGAVMVVNVWASWSPYTQADHKSLAHIKKEFKDSVSILAFNRKETPETAVAYLDTIGREPGIEYVIDGTDQFFNSLGGYAMPETIVFDEVGNIQFHKRGTVDEAELSEVLRTLLEKK